MHDRAKLATVLAAVAAAASVALLPTAGAQIPPLVSTTTTGAPATTTAPPPSSDQPSGGELASGSEQAPAGAADAGGDGAAPPAGGIAVPPEAQLIINSVRRSGPSDNDALVAAMGQLEALGLTRDEAMRVGFGRFPIAGPASYVHDWLFPRYGPGFRFHLGTDVFAPYGTPVRAPVDGVARTSTNSLGGLAVKVFMEDGTYFYMAHLSGLVDGFVEGMQVSTGDIVGYVGDSGNARGGAPHVHFSIYPKGGPPVDPKPILDGFLTEALERVPALVAAYQQAQPAPLPAPTGAVPISEEQRALRPMLSSLLLQPLAGGGDEVVAPELLYAAAANPTSGALPLLEAEIDALVAGIDWNVRAASP